MCLTAHENPHTDLLSVAVLTSISAQGHTPDASELPARFQPEPETPVQITGVKGRIHLQIAKDKPVEIGELDPDSGMTGNSPVIIADFNFDRADDLVALDGIGYSGASPCSTFATTAPNSRFTRREKKGPAG